MQFRHKNSLVRHLCQHTGDRPHPCQICGQAFISTHRMREHVKKYHPKAAHQMKSKDLSQPSSKATSTVCLKDNSIKRCNSLTATKKTKKGDVKMQKSKSQRFIMNESRNGIEKCEVAEHLSSVDIATSADMCKNELSVPENQSNHSINEAKNLPGQQHVTQLQAPFQPTATFNVPVMSLVQASNGQLFLIATSPPPPQNNQLPERPLNSTNNVSTSNLVYLPSTNTIQPIHINTQQPEFSPQEGYSNQPQQFVSNVIQQNNYHTMIIGGQLPGSFADASKTPIVRQRQPNDLIVQNTSTNFQNYSIQTDLPKSENTKCILPQDSQTKQSILTSYGRQHQQNISKTRENQANTITTNITTLNSSEHLSHLQNQENDVNVMAQLQQQQQQSTNSSSTSINQPKVMSLESLKQLSTTSSLFPSSSINVHKQIQLSKGKIESQLLPSPTIPLISFDNTTHQTTQNDSYLYKRSENEEEQQQELNQKNPCDIHFTPFLKNNKCSKEEAIVSINLEQEESKKKINCLRSIRRRKPDIEHIFPTNISMPRLPQQENTAMLSSVKEDEEISWSNYNSSVMKEGDKTDIDLIKRIPAQLTKFSLSSSLSHPSMSFSNGYFSACNTSTAGEETLRTINFGENEESLGILEKQESNNNMTKTGNKTLDDIIKVALVESKVC